MSWRIVLHQTRPESLRVGDMFPAPWLRSVSFADDLSAAYKAQRSSVRDPWVVRLPGPVDFCIDSRACRDGQSYGNGWTVTGEGAAITLSPSININGIYHGWIRDGVISDDCEGRRYDADGRLP